MALRWLDGFEHYGVEANLWSKYYWGGDIGSFATSPVRTGTYCIYGAYNDGIILSLPQIGWSTATEVYTGIAFQVTALSTGANDFIRMMATTSSDHSRIRFEGPTNTFYLYDSTSSIIDTDATGYVSVGVWHYAEFYTKVGGVGSGEVIFRIDGIEVFNESTSGDYQYGTENYIEHVNIGFPQSMGYMDDFYVDDAQFHGAIKVHTFFPDSDGTHTDFVRNTGSNDYECVDDFPTPDDDTSYIEGSTLGDKSTFGFTLTGITNKIVGVQVNHRISKTGGTTAKAKAIARVSSTDYQGSKEISLGEGYGYFSGNMWEVNPNTSNLWTKTTVEAAEFGLEITSLSTTTTT